MELMKLLESVGSSGVVGAILAVMLWFNYKLVTKLFGVIETNTQTIVSINETQKLSLTTIKENTNIIQVSMKDQQSHIEQAERTHDEIHRLSLELGEIQKSLLIISSKHQ